ncbi:MAG: hypothetical protein Q8P74_00715 [bacterium]|nr:hypothetical protein [bacterium]
MKGNYFKLANSVGLFLAALFVVCFVWYYIRPIEQELHSGLFRLVFFGFNGMNFSSFIAGIIQSYLWAYIGVGIWKLIKR